MSIERVGMPALRGRWIVVLVTLGVMAGSAALASRLDAQEARDAAVARAVGTLREGEPIRIALMRTRFAGRYAGSQGDTLFFGERGEHGEPPMAFRLNAVDTLWRVIHPTRMGATIGVIAGAVAGGVLVGGKADDAAVGVLGGAVGGGLLGAVIGRASRSWRRIYP